jgi:hypothetical protein
MKKLSVSLFDCRCNDAERKALVERYKDALIARAGSVKAVIEIYEASKRAMEAQNGWRADDDATEEEEAAFQAWTDLDNAAHHIAFADWLMGSPESAYFHIEVRS